MKGEKFSFIIPLVIYPFDVFVSVNHNDKELFDLIKHNGTKEDLAPCFDLPSTCIGRSVLLPNNASVLRIFTKRCADDKQLVGVIAHEVFHIASYVMWKIGTPLEVMVSDESYAYLIQYLTEVIYDKIFNKNK